MIIVWEASWRAGEVVVWALGQNRCMGPLMPMVARGREAGGRLAIMAKNQGFDGVGGLGFFYFYFFIFQILSLFTSLWVMTDFKYLYIHALAWLLALDFLSSFAFSRRGICSTSDFWVIPPEFSQVGLHLPHRFSAAILSPSIRLLLSPTRLLFLRTLAAAPPLFRFLIGWQPISSDLLDSPTKSLLSLVPYRVFSVVSSTCDIS